MTIGSTFTFVCPSCDTVAEISSDLLGHEYECPECFEKCIARATTERQCPVCGKTVKYHAAICKFCKADLTKLPPEVGNAARLAQEEKFIFICPECDTVAELPISMKGQSYSCKACCEESAAVPAEERKCPCCGEKIKIHAAICKHCRRTVLPLMLSTKRAGGLQSKPGLNPIRQGPPGGLTQHFSGQAINTVSPKSRLALFFLNMVWPGAGQIYLGQARKGWLLIAGYFLLALLLGVLVPDSLQMISRIILLGMYGFVVGDSFYIMTKIELGLPVDPMDFSTPGKGKALKELLSPEMKKTQLRYMIPSLICLLLGLNLPAIIGLVVFITCR